MSVIELLLVSFGLSMDSFAVSICKGLSIKKINFKKEFILGFYFSFFHVFMLLIGFFLGTSFEKFISNFDHWVAFILLLIIGVNMIIESNKKDKKINSKINFKSMFPLLVATSIDALTVGITFAFLKVNVLIGIVLVGIITFLMSIIGLKIGKKFKSKYEKKSKIIGGIILMLIGLKVLLEHLKII